MTTPSRYSSPTYPYLATHANSVTGQNFARNTPVAYPSAIVNDGRPYLLPIEPADRCTVGETVAVVSRDGPIKISASALPIDKTGRMKPVQLMSALYHEQKPNAKRHQK